jgi:hypothetical protein
MRLPTKSKQLIICNFILDTRALSEYYNLGVIYKLADSNSLRRRLSPVVLIINIWGYHSIAPLGLREP